MPLVSTESLLKAAVERRSAVAAFNVITLEHVEAVLEGAQAAARPVILQVSENAVRFHGGQVLPVARAAGAARPAGRRRRRTSPRPRHGRRPAAARRRR